MQVDLCRARNAENVIDADEAVQLAAEARNRFVCKPFRPHQREQIAYGERLRQARKRHRGRAEREIRVEGNGPLCDRRLKISLERAQFRALADERVELRL